MENSTIALIVYCVSVGLMAAVFIYFMCRDYCGKSTPASELRNLHFTPPAPPSSAWQTKTEKKNEQGGPWFLVVYETADRYPYVISADDILRFMYATDGSMMICCKSNIGVDSNEITLTGKYRFEFLPASELGDYLFTEEEDENVPTARETYEYWHKRFKDKGLLD